MSTTLPGSTNLGNQTFGEESNSKFNNRRVKIAFIILALLLLVVLSEIGYLVFSGKHQTIFNKNLLTSITGQPKEGQNVEINLPIPPLVEDKYYPRVEANPDEAIDFAGKMEHLWETKPTFLKRSVVEFTLEGTISHVTSDYREGYPFTIFLVDDSENELEYSFSQNELENNIEAYLVHNNQVSVIKPTDIKPGDLLTIKSVANLLDPAKEFQVVFQAVRAN